MAEENQDEDLGQEVFLDDQTEEDTSSTETDEPVSDAQVADAAARVEEGEDNLEDYSASVQKRIGKLTAKLREAERQGQEATTFAQQVFEENKKLKGRMEKLDTGYMSEYGARIEAQIGAARKAYKEAYEAGDTDAMIQAQESLARATTDKDRYEHAKKRAEDRPQQAAPEATSAQAQQPAYQQTQQQQPAPQQQTDPKAQSWAENNPWFGQDEVMTYAAFGIHRKLVEEEGFDPQSDEYYNAIDQRMRREFPHKFSEPKSSKKSQVAPAGSSASRSTKQGRKSVKLSPSQVAIAKKLNVPLEEYAKYVKD
ncbi:MAG: hypothetical protein RI553_11210 [Salibaculum sp.]|jgi:hypothetical protein|uniref:hypothetical protein n=1 Tax=Salibaculum sp. TaxID=2855480 RepID=UPI0028707E0C|nr:hypothetical protein [Salibaculum sp.]MDR9428661.1 hypothetical protein [Salibaculum sp.]